MKFRILDQAHQEIAVLNLQELPRKGEYISHGGEIYVILKIVHSEGLITLIVNEDKIGHDELQVEWS
ncbi:hypothetical protein [uncultured Psychroserpens sp.]|uniref:hypothetical protein n=1 Tax=uncultured Psychroserpens sp. TaxID=255436 RepID=UPI0026224694|nr:hypothetical protein [uncultured Psychroserpens sp.]